MKGKREKIKHEDKVDISAGVSEEVKKEAGKVSEDDLRLEIEKVKGEASENYDRYLRLAAEFENFKKRAQRERTDLVNYGIETLVKDILPSLDSLERALDHATDSNDLDAFVEGLKLIYEKLLGALAKHGVEKIESVGRNFDPNFHEALMQVESDEYENNAVAEEFERGYLLNGRLLRPSKVSIAKNARDKNETE